MPRFWPRSNHHRRRLLTLCEGDLEKLEELARNDVEEFAQIIEAASLLLRDGKVTEDFWIETGDRCMTCTACNPICPPCMCFDVYNWKYYHKTMRPCLWVSYQPGGFMREGSGHIPMGTEALRTRRPNPPQTRGRPGTLGNDYLLFVWPLRSVCSAGTGIEAVSREIYARFG